MVDSESALGKATLKIASTTGPRPSKGPVNPVISLRQRLSHSIWLSIKPGQDSRPAATTLSRWPCFGSEHWLWAELSAGGWRFRESLWTWVARRQRTTYPGDWGKRDYDAGVSIQQWKVQDKVSLNPGWSFLYSNFKSTRSTTYPGLVPFQIPHSRRRLSLLFQIIITIIIWTSRPTAAAAASAAARGHVDWNHGAKWAAAFIQN